jgi:hypothetical protein
MNVTALFISIELDGVHLEDGIHLSMVSIQVNNAIGIIQGWVSTPPYADFLQ